MALKLHRGEKTQLAWGNEGTWGTADTVDQWFGEGFDDMHTPDENPGVNRDPLRYVGANGNRNVDKWGKTNTEYTGTINFNVQKPYIFWYGMGTSQSDDSGSPTYVHTISEIAGSFMPSFTMEDWQGEATNMNVKRIYEGCTVDTMELSCSEGEKVNCSIDYVAEDFNMESGTKSSVSAHTDDTFRWEHCLLHLSGNGYDSDMQTMKDWTWSVNHNLDTPRYQKNTANISQPIPMERDYEFTFTINAPAGSAYDWFDKFHIGGSAFELDLYMFRTSGTDDVQINMSGCHADIDQPIKNKGTVEQSWTVKPTKCEMTVRDSTTVSGTDVYEA